eukprot:scaffold214042_cov35-Tisochrysis_lutea.AAC.2
MPCSSRRYLACEWGPSGVRVNAIAPWFISTPLTRPLLNKPDFAAAVRRVTPLRRWGEAHEVACTVAFLAMPAAGYISGALAIVAILSTTTLAEDPVLTPITDYIYKHLSVSNALVRTTTATSPVLGLLAHYITTTLGALAHAPRRVLMPQTHTPMYPPSNLPARNPPAPIITVGSAAYGSP